jgi:hypothetical protein
MANNRNLTTNYAETTTTAESISTSSSSSIDSRVRFEPTHNSTRLLPRDDVNSTVFEIARGPASNGNGNFPMPPGQIQTFQEWLTNYRSIIGAVGYGPEEFDRLQDTFINSIIAHKNKYGTMTEVSHVIKLYFPL